jgi:hypothetical protein
MHQFAAKRLDAGFSNGKGTRPESIPAEAGVMASCGMHGSTVNAEIGGIAGNLNVQS